MIRAFAFTLLDMDLMTPSMPQLLRMTRRLHSLWRDTRGATAIEYGLIVALIALSLVAGARSIGNQLNTTFNAASSGMSIPAS